MPKISKELEREILGMSTQERHKLLLRLIGKDKILIEQLEFKLLEDPVIDLKLREDAIRDRFEPMAKTYTTKYPNQLLQYFRQMIGEINHHKKVTADKIGEIRLTLDLLCYLRTYFSATLEIEYNRFAEKLNIYFLKKIISTIKKLDSIHEDYRIEFTEAFNDLLDYCHNYTYKTDAKFLNLPKSID